MLALLKNFWVAGVHVGDREAWAVLGSRGLLTLIDAVADESQVLNLFVHFLRQLRDFFKE